MHETPVFNKDKIVNPDVKTPNIKIIEEITIPIVPSHKTGLKNDSIYE